MSDLSPKRTRRCKFADRLEAALGIASCKAACIKSIPREHFCSKDFKTNKGRAAIIDSRRGLIALSRFTAMQYSVLAYVLTSLNASQDLI